jgi:hypothetical protein
LAQLTFYCCVRQESLHLLSRYKDSKTIPVPKLGIRFEKDGMTPFYDERYFKFWIMQGYSIEAKVPNFQDAHLTADCEMLDPEGKIRYDSVYCPVSDMTFEGADGLEQFRFVRVSCFT